MQPITWDFLNINGELESISKKKCTCIFTDVYLADHKNYHSSLQLFLSRAAVCCFIPWSEPVACFGKWDVVWAWTGSLPGQSCSHDASLPFSSIQTPNCPVNTHSLTCWTTRDVILPSLTLPWHPAASRNRAAKQTSRWPRYISKPS